MGCICCLFAGVLSVSLDQGLVSCKASHFKWRFTVTLMLTCGLNILTGRLVRGPVRALTLRGAVLRAMAAAAMLDGKQLLRRTAQVLAPATRQASTIERSAAEVFLHGD